MTENNKPMKRDTGGERNTPDTGVVMIYATFPDRAAALALGRDLVERGLAGCINVLPAMTSVYVWQGVTETADEAVLIAKLAGEGASRAVDYIVANHPYDTPAVIVIPVAGGNSRYLDWVRAGTDQGTKP